MIDLGLEGGEGWGEVRSVGDSVRALAVGRQAIALSRLLLAVGLIKIIGFYPREGRYSVLSRQRR